MKKKTQLIRRADLAYWESHLPVELQRGNVMRALGTAERFRRRYRAQEEKAKAAVQRAVIIGFHHLLNYTPRNA